MTYSKSEHIYKFFNVKRVKMLISNDYLYYLTIIIEVFILVIILWAYLRLSRQWQSKQRRILVISYQLGLMAAFLIELLDALLPENIFGNVVFDDLWGFSTMIGLIELKRQHFTKVWWLMPTTFFSAVLFIIFILLGPLDY
ncbi:hypothetical protein HMPREF3225_01416 [Staphylococcus lugdunensis]|uniref:Uncharacterized protein n=2 Tax=Staphylococcus lugdunensis TaxID=28035 RepID=A0ABD4EF79_STALU|nr:hypothetical protein HMPREF0790_1821 [Staphylococcus lugdunensis M23590]KXA37922.1 hypothetical protein HMPREF3225_01416 [Staphylococcus lugdunensis]